MSIYFTGAFTRSGGLPSAISKQIKLLNLKPVKKIFVQFDPLHPKAVTARNLLVYISSPKVAGTNLDCLVKSNVVCDRSEPHIKVDLLEAGSFKFLLNNLTELEILQQFNKRISSLAKPEEATETLQLNLTKKIKKK